MISLLLFSLILIILFFIWSIESINPKPVSLSNMPNKTSTIRRTTDLKFPIKSDGTKDKRYTTPQFVNKDGSKDMRTTSTNQRK